MKKIWKIAYFGADEEFVESLDRYCRIAFDSDFKIFQQDYTYKSLLENSVAEFPNIIFIDLMNIKNQEDLFQEISFIKRNSKLKSIFFAGIIKNFNTNKILRHLYTSGFQLAHIKGAEVQSFLLDSFYVGCGQLLASTQYAKASDIDLEVEIGLCSSLVKISSKGFCIESDLSLQCEELSFNLSIFPDLEASVFSVDEHYTSALIHSFTDTYSLEYPFVGPWDEMTAETIQKETVETWIDNNRDDLILKSHVIKVITKNLDQFPQLLEVSGNLPIVVDVEEEFDFCFGPQFTRHLI